MESLTTSVKGCCTCVEGIMGIIRGLNSMAAMVTNRP